MIDQKNFERIVTDLQNHVLSYTQSDVEDLVVSLMEMDQHLAIAQQTLDFTLNTAERLMADVAQSCVNTIGIRDAAKKRKLAAIAGQAAGQLAGAVQLFVAGQIIQAQEAVQFEVDDSAVDGLEGEAVGDEPTAGPVGTDS
jgi:hypothetical protein